MGKEKNETPFRSDETGKEKNETPFRFERMKTNDMYSSWKIKIPLIFSLISSVSILVFGFVGMFLRTAVRDFLQGGHLPAYFYFWKENLLFFFQANIVYYFFMFFVGAIMIYACLLMWNGHRTGVNLYAFGRTSGLLLPIFFFGQRGFALGDVMLAGLFIAYYYIYMLRNYTKTEIEE